MTSATEMKWMPKNSKPAKPGWHYVREVTPRLCVGIRYFDDSKDGSWWAACKDGIVPNDTFFDWLNVPGISDRQQS